MAEGTSAGGAGAQAAKETEGQGALRQEEPKAKAAPDEASLAGLLLRDGLTLAVALAIWGGAEAWAAVSGLAIAKAMSVVNGIAAGLLVAAVLHEWGHYAGAKLAGAIAPRTRPKELSSLFRFQFDLRNNSLRQFTALGIGGNIAHWLAFVALLALLPLETAGEAALVAGAFAFAVGASVLEAPIISRSLRGRVQPARAFDHLTKAALRRHAVIGGIAGLAFAAAA